MAGKHFAQFFEIHGPLALGGANFYNPATGIYIYIFKNIYIYRNIFVYNMYYKKYNILCMILYTLQIIYFT